MRSTFSVGVIGLGVGSHHVEAFLSHPEVKTCLVADLNAAKVKDICQRYPGRALAVSSAEDIINNTDVSIVSVASYDNFHVSQVLAAIAKEKHVFVEKPMCLTPDEAQSISAALGLAKGIKLSSNMVLRTCPRFIRLKAAFEQGNLGRVYTVRADYLWGRVEKLTSGWRKETPGYSVIYGASVHMIDLACWVLGRFPEKVHAVGNRIATQDEGFEPNDFANMFLTFEDGLIVEVSAHGGCVHPHFHQLEVWGSRKTFIHHSENACWLEQKGDSILRSELEGEYPAKPLRRAVAISFVDYVLGRVARPIVSSEEVFKVMSICFAAEKSMKTGKTIQIEYIK